MNALRLTSAAALLGLSAAMTSPVAKDAPTLDVAGGATTVQLSPVPLEALDSLGVTPGAVRPGRLIATNRGATAFFPS